MELFAEIVVPIAHEPFTFRVPEVLSDGITEGMGVEVQLGANKIYMGIVWRLTNEKPPFRTKDITRIMTAGRLLSDGQMALWRWVSEYYMCTLGDVMRFALPAALKPRGGSPEEFSKDEYRPLTVRYISLHPSVDSEERLDEICEGLRRSRAQYAALMELCSLLPDGGLFGGEVPRGRLKAGATIIKKLTDKNIFLLKEREWLPEDEVSEGLLFELPVLTPAQQGALQGIGTHFAARDVALLHGVTGSGKTEIYMHLIAGQLERGKSVLYMMPEIAMTSQLIARIKKVFGERVIVYHSKLSDRKRAEAYRRLNRSEGGELILGVRSSIFLPLPELGLVIVDEEHDAGYKQSDNAPRYHARDCAAVIARLWGAKCLLASATPSVESYVNATSGKYGLVTLAERYGNARLPRITISDTLSAVKRGERKVHFNKLLMDRMRETLAEGRQVMLFQNRRGFAPYVECGECGWTARCPRCGVTLTFHKQDNRLRCHTCGYSKRMPEACPGCSAPSPKPCGFGTEKVEEELSRLFPDARIARLDRDTATTAARYERIIKDFEKGETDILVGTQMITKGFDFPKLSLVGILNADNLLNYPDFRASERAYQTMTQVAGRAGRADDKGEVIIQTSQPEHPVIKQVQALDYTGMVRDQLAERQPFHYPPYGRLITVMLKHYKPEILERGAGRLAARMRTVFEERVYGPHAPVVEKMAGESILVIMLKIENGRSSAKAKELLAGMIAEFSKEGEFRRISVACNVDPQ